MLVVKFSTKLSWSCRYHLSNGGFRHEVRESTFRFTADDGCRTLVDEVVVLLVVGEFVPTARFIPRRLTTVCITLADSLFTGRVVTAFSWRRVVGR